MPRKRAKAEKTATGDNHARDRSRRPPSGDIFSLLLDLLAERLPLPGGVISHLRNAELEVLKALKVLIEMKIRRLEDRHRGAQPPRVEKVEIR